ncbi:unnamed protein product [Rotaria socialis]|uniref:Transposase n=1 Tax=Rotaria socialis TaxID=392032 RepID=A0A821VIH3_9BILA|nr:unnamed protein product [Rotaria socialis]
MYCIDISSSSSTDLVEQYSTSSIENLLKQKDQSKQFMVVKNDQKYVSSPAWSTFGFPAKRVEDGSCQRIIGFASCFACKDTYSYQYGGSGSTKYLLRHLTAHDCTLIRDELTKWICSSVRPFNIVSDPGLKITLQTVMNICQKYQGPINAEDILVTPPTIANNVHKLAEYYRSLIRPVLIDQAESGALCVCPDLWNDQYKKVDYLGLTAFFVTSAHGLYSFDVCCARYNENDKTGQSVLQISRLVKNKCGNFGFKSECYVYFKK